ncbi:MAG TPA: PEGA domain-containing protein [Terriglobia bacterium]|nr:PEGA domain-containing protein [Terriglobia bacterium]
MSHRLWLMCVMAVSFLTLTTPVWGQSSSVANSPVPGSHQRFPGPASEAYQNSGSASRYVYASAPKPQDSGQQQSNESQGQSQNGNQDQGMAGSQNQNQNQNQDQKAQGQKKEEAPPEKPTYLTYTVKKKSLEEQAKTGKTLSVEFKSVPAGATIMVDGYQVGHTPATVQIPLGKHLVTITKWGYESWSQDLDVASGKKLSLNPSLHKDW